ncbi:glycosyltransferase [Actinocorallia longicatena]|uniref:Glycosyltransferase family 2 protein n=1 Tax=Actinocorallia longicatena TaxID=111803 RepID=A0ABP6PX74_9ACTN
MSPIAVEIVVPAFNEAERLPAGLELLCRRLERLPARAAVLVVDNASSDATAEIVRQWPGGPVEVRLIHCAKRGKGAAVRAGILSSRAGIVGFCDADMATDPAVLDTVLQMMRVHPVIIGSRTHLGSRVEARHSRTRSGGALLFRRIAGRLVPGVGDTQCGFKFFHGDLARQAARRQRSNGFAFDVELLARCVRMGAAPVEVPVTWNDVPGSKFSVLRHGLPVIAELARIWFLLRRTPAVRAVPSASAAEIALIRPAA